MMMSYVSKHFWMFSVQKNGYQKKTQKLVPPRPPPLYRTSFLKLWSTYRADSLLFLNMVVKLCSTYMEWPFCFSGKRVLKVWYGTIPMNFVSALKAVEAAGKKSLMMFYYSSRPRSLLYDKVPGTQSKDRKTSNDFREASKNYSAGFLPLRGRGTTPFR